MKNYYLLLVCLVLTACNPSMPPGEVSAGSKEAATDKTEVVLTPEQLAAANIGTQTAEISSQPELLRVKGKIALADDHMWQVGVRTPGLVIFVYAGLGDYVHKGQILARYHADEVRDSRAQYRATLAELDRAKATVAQAQRNLDRAQKLLELKAGSVQQVEFARQDLITAQDAVRKAEIEADRGKDLLEDDLRVPADPPANRKDETEDDVPIIASGDGYIIEKNITPGKAIALTDVTFVIGDLSKVWMLAAVHQEDLGKLRMGQPASVTLPGFEGMRFSGKITNLGQEIDPATRVMQVRIELQNAGNRLRPEMLADAEIPVGAGRAVIFVSSDAVQQVNDQDVVFVRTAQERFAIRPVQTGETTDGRTPILEGIRPGEKVVSRGSFILKSQLLRSSLESE